MLPTEKQTYLKSNKSFTKGGKKGQGNKIHTHSFLLIYTETKPRRIYKKLVIMVTYRGQKLGKVEGTFQ